MNIFYPPEQEKIFAVMLVLGLILGIIYDLFKIKRHIFGNKRISLFIDDLIFSIISISVFLLTVFVVNNGIFRWFEAFFCIVGFILYRISLSKLILKFAYKVADVLIYVFKSVLTLILFPFAGTIKLLKKYLIRPVIAIMSRHLRLYNITSSFYRLTKTGKCTYEK